MKPIKFDLPLNSIRVATLDQLEENLTPEILQHFRSGKLAKWLRVRHLNEQADKVEALLAADIEVEVQLFKNVCEVFVDEVEENDAREAIEEYNATIKDMNKEEKEPVEYQPAISMDSLPPDIQDFMQQQITNAVAQTTTAMLGAQSMLNKANEVIVEASNITKPIEVTDKTTTIEEKNNDVMHDFKQSLESMFLNDVSDSEWEQIPILNFEYKSKAPKVIKPNIIDHVMLFLNKY